ncbi:MAG: killer suppression protein HigA [Bacteroidetes bacterium]|nr:killer suppression protein HigA [Bacteroidota bacterium]
MEIHYAGNKMEKKLSSATEIKKAFGTNALRVQRRIDEIRASPCLAVLMQIPAANCHRLTGNRKGEWALNISANHRMIFEIADDPLPKNEDGSVNTILVREIRIINTEDYH